MHTRTIDFIREVQTKAGLQSALPLYEEAFDIIDHYHPPTAIVCEYLKLRHTEGLSTPFFQWYVQHADRMSIYNGSKQRTGWGK